MGAFIALGTYSSSWNGVLHGPLLGQYPNAQGFSSGISSSQSSTSASY
ncbi:MAG: hypothetical protein ACKO96_05785 [Flammeovirgaceae bacterium]